MVIVTGNLGIFSQSRLERISMDVSSNAGDNNIKLNQVLDRVKRLEAKERALPKSFVNKRLRNLEKGIQGGRGEESSQKLHGQKLQPEYSDDPISKFDVILLSLGLKGRSQKLTSKSLLSGAGAPIQKNQEFKKLSAKVTRLQKTQRAMTESLLTIQPLISGASGLRSVSGIGSLILNQAAKIGLPVFFVTIIATKVWKMYKAQYGKGGTRDIRKLVLDEDVSRIGIDNENELDSGANLFMSYPQILTGLPRGPSNTENLREGMARWKQRKEGTYR